MAKLKTHELERLSAEEFKVSEKIPIVVVLDNIRSAMNVGSFFRTADAFALKKLIICGISATPPHREINKTALGATCSVDWEYVDKTEDALVRLLSEGYEILVVEQTDKSILLQDFILENQKSYALVFGNEVEGVSDNLFQFDHKAIEIPQYGTKHSLNVTICGGIVLWEMVRQLIAKKA
jgi:23S rRNA (guanosine2251-2'-O)-methyltransferase